MTHFGSCHCGKIAISFTETPTEAIACNCSICRRRGSLLAAIAPDAFRLETSRENLSSYTFHPHSFRHLFCKACGCAPFGEGLDFEGECMVVINLRCTDVDLEQVKVVPFDGEAI